MACLASRHPYTRFVCALLTWLQFVPLALALKGDSACRYSLCVAASVDGDVVTYELTANNDPMGWVAVGFGQRMINTHMVILWKNADGTTTLSQRYADGYSMPQPELHPPRIASIVEPNKSFEHASGSSTVAFQIPANQSLLASTSPIEELIFAYSPTRPDKDPNSIINRHAHVGYFKFDLAKEFKPATLSSSPVAAPKPNTVVYQGSHMSYKRIEKLIILHGFLVSLGFLVILPIGSLIGRWGRNFTPKWFRAHWMANMAFAAPVITLGVLLGPAIVYSKETFRIHLANAHEVYGILLLFVYYVQVLLGRYIHNRRIALSKLGPVTNNHPPLNILHICLGVSIIGLSFFQVRSGMEWWETLTGRGPITSWALPLWKAWIIALPLAYFSGYVLLTRQLRQEQAAAYVPIAESNSEGPSQTSRLLAEAEDEDR
ncbi:hypothetical protein BDN70DRAFT_928938 [Pholiota conissans]|uniref:DOMON domain-containing protein n=1 Tax=Pholiota conissans TaxID=109636 RepID=A0A9P5Z8V5_9AGAR|nr:hypothetical protein BDN70DRAFT_928938 [Pholiota conissans]